MAKLTKKTNRPARIKSVEEAGASALPQSGVKPKGRPRKVHAPRPVIPVTADIIATAVRKSSQHCMIADAIKAAFPEFTNVAVDLQTIRFSDPKRRLRYTYLTPRNGQVGLINFDRGAPPDPFQLRLRGAHITSMRQPGRGKQKKAAHKLGKKRFNLRGQDKQGTVPETIGGKPPPPIRGRGFRREFGMRAFSLDDLVPAGGEATPSEEKAA